MKYFSTTGAVLLTAFAARTANAIELDPNDEASILAVTRQYAYSLMSLYKGNATGTPIEDVGVWPQPHYWWEGGAAWGGVIEYSQISGDDSHVKALQQALTANYGPKNDFILEYRRSQTGSDDQCFWAIAAMSAVEYQFPNPADAPADYLEVATNAFNGIVGRWDETSCAGGLKWQIYPENSYGYNYKNSISNGCAFALGARLARYTGEQKYADWSVKLYDWSKRVGLITDKFEVFDGTDDKTNCSKVADETQWTYNNAMFLHGSAFMYDFTKGDQIWKDRVSGFLNHAGALFFGPYDNATDIMYEWACETGESGRNCNLDQQTFKAYLSRFMAKTALLAPFTKDTVVKYLTASAVGAAKSCSGGTDGKTCGSKWYTGGWDGTSGVGQQMCALEVTQALLQIQKNMLPVKNSGAKPSKPPMSSAAPSNQTSAPTPTPLPIDIPSSEAPAGHAPEAVAPRQPGGVAAPAPAPGLDVPAAVNATSPPAPSSSCVYNVTRTVTVAASSSTSTSCTPSVTLTRTVPYQPTGPAASVPLNSTMPSVVSPPVSGNTSTPGLPEFPGAASTQAASSSVWVMVVAVAVFALV